MRVLLSAVACVTFAVSGVALAADLPLKAPAPIAAPPLWTGFYAGLNAGGNWGHSDSSTEVVSGGDFFASPICFPPANGCVVNTIDVHTAGAQRTDTSGFTGGAQAGYNWQTGNLVLGLEGDIDYFRSAGTSSKTVGLVSGRAGHVIVTSSMSTDWLFTLRPRVGWAVDNWLFYGTGGLAVTDLKPSWTFNETAFGNSAVGSFTDTKAGWTVGAGIETMLPGKWILGAEYLFVKFDNASQTVPVVLPLGGGPAPQNFSHSADLESNIVRARVSKGF
jgi:outer membrane immunogenic protein